jgi:SAM-dependent methyltransferase
MTRRASAAPYGGPAAVRGVLGRGALGAVAAPLLTATAADGLHRWLARAGVGPASPILDVGCGGGALLRAMADAGYRDLTGIDPYAPRPEVGPPVTIRREALDDHEGSTRSSCSTTCWSTCPTRARRCAGVRALLGPGGHALVRVPIVPSAAWNRYEADWAQLDAPRHPHDPSARGLTAIAEATRLALVASAHDSTPFQFWASRWNAREASPLSDAARRVGFVAKRRDWPAARRVNAERRGDQAAFLFRARAD